MGIAKKSFTTVGNDKKGILKPKAAQAEKPSGNASHTKKSIGKTNSQGVTSKKSAPVEIKLLREELAQRGAELQIINSIQQGLAAELDFQAIIDMVGDKLREVFHTGNFGIRWYDNKTNLVHFLYEYEHGVRLNISAGTPTPGGTFEQFFRDRQPLLGNTAEIMARTGGTSIPGTDTSKSLISVPIISSDRVIGSLQMENYERENAYGESELRLLTTIAASLGTALESARLFDEIQKKNIEITEAFEQQTATNEVLRVMASSPTDFQPVLEVIAKNAGRVCGADDAHIYRVDGEALKEWTHLGPIPGLKDGEWLPLSRGSVIGRAILEREPIHIRDAEVELDDSEYPISAALQHRWGYRTVLAIPLLREGEPIGGIAIRRTEVRPFTEKEIDLLRSFADQAVIAIENVRLFSETQRLLKETEQRAAELALINGVQQGLASKLDIQAIIELVGEKIRDVFDTQTTYIALHDKTSQTFHIPYYLHQGNRLVVEGNYPTSQGPTGHILQTRETLWLKEDANRQLIELGATTVAEDDKPQSWLGVPMIAGDEVVGMISLQNIEREHAYSEADVSLLKTIASSLAVALQNAQLFEETNRLLKETEQRNAELAIINAIGQIITEELDLNIMVEHVGDKLQETLKLKNIGIGIYNENENVMQVPFISRDGVRLTVQPFTLNAINRRVSKAGRSIVVNKDAEKLWRKFGGLSATDEIPRSFVMVPLMAGRELMGGISLQDFENEDAFTDLSVSLLETIASNLGTAILNARLTEKIQHELWQQTQAKEREEHRRVILEKVITTGQLVTEVHDVRTTLTRIWHGVHDDLGFDRLGMYLFNPERNSMDGTFGTNNQGEIVDEWHTWISLDGKTEEAKSFLQVLEKPDTILLTHNYESENNIPEGHIMSGVQDFAAIGAWAGAKPVAVLCVDHKITGRRITEEQLEALRLFAGYAGLAIENARLIDETQRLLKETEQRAAELSVINSISQSLSRRLDLEPSISLVGDKLGQLFDTQYIYIALYDQSTNHISFPYFWADGKLVKDETQFEFGEGITSHVLRTREHLLINSDATHRLQEMGAVIVNYSQDLKSSLIVPILANEQAIGTLALQSSKRENLFTDADVRLLTTIASNIGASLQNARLFDETEQRAAELAIINSVQADLSASLETQSMYQLVGDKLREIFDAQVVTLVEYDPQNNRSYWRYAVEKGETLNIQPSAPAGFSRYIIENRQMILVNENMAERRRELGGQVTAGNPAKSYLGVPLFLNNQVRGVISLQNVDRENAFSSSDVRLLTTLANSMSVALENARLFDETKQRAAELATINTVSSALASELDVDHLIQLMGEQTRMAFKSDITYVALLNEATKTITFPYIYGEQLGPLRYGEGLTSKIIQTGQPLLFNNDVTEQSQQIGATIVGVESMSYLGVPIMMGGKAVGVVSVQSTSRENAFDEADQRLLSTIAANVGSALHNARLYKEARESRAVAEQANKAKSTFLANMSHELRTPLNAIIGFTRIVRKKSDGLLPVKQLENLDKVLTSSEHLLGLINTVLDIAKIEAGRMDVIPGNFSISALADQCSHLAAPLLKPKVKLQKQVDVNLGIIYSDQDKIKQIVLNLLSNAAKFTHEGEITLRAEKCDEDTLRMSVADSGIGISEEALARIFDEFQQADASTTRQYGGTGLGLAISRNLARLLGGDLTATSELGKGSTFSLTIPMYYGRKATSQADVRPDSTEPTASYAQTDSAKKRVLVIDDDPDAAYLLQESLNQNEFTVTGAPNGHTGLELARETQPDAILLDILMPETDGWQVLNDLKMDQATMDIPVILLTIVDKKALGFKLGAAAYLLKPLNPTVVLDALHRVIGEKDHPHKHVLVVDDDPNIAEMLRQTLTEADYVLAVAEDGEAGLQAIEARRPDVILLDLMMPKLDGFGVIERLRSDPELRNIPIIVISAKELTEEESKTLKESVAFVMKKQGFNDDLLMEEINSVVRK